MCQCVGLSIALPKYFWWRMGASCLVVSDCICVALVCVRECFCVRARRACVCKVMDTYVELGQLLHERDGAHGDADLAVASKLHHALAEALSEHAQARVELAVAVQRQQHIDGRLAHLHTMVRNRTEK